MLEFPLYHGTSTIFLESIKKHGLGGRDPIKEWRVLECAKLLLPLAEQYANRSEVIKVHLGTTRAMVAQVNDHINFQHGQVYLSPVESTAVRYATSKKKGSVLVSRVVLLIKELTRLEVKAVTTDLYREFPKLVELQDIDAAPVLIKVDKLIKTVSCQSREGRLTKISSTSGLLFLNGVVIGSPCANRLTSVCLSLLLLMTLRSALS